MKKITLLLALFLISSLGFAQDDCTTAIVVTEGSRVDDQIAGDGTAANGDDIWFSFTPASTGLISISVCADISDPDTDVYLYDGTCGTLNQIGTDDDGCVGTFESLLEGVPVTMGNTYYIQFLDTWEETPFDWVLSVLPAEANDNFANAEAVICGGNYTGNTSNATLDLDDSPDGFGADMDAPNVWYSYDSSSEGAGDITIDLCPSAYDTSVLVYTGSPGINGETFTLVAGNDDNGAQCGGSGGTTRSYLTFTANGTDIYWIAVEGWNPTSTGSFDMTVTCAASCSPAQANQDCASAVGIAVDGSTTTVDNTCASVNASQPSCDLFNSIADVWYSFTAPPSGAVDIARTLVTATAAHAAVYDGSCGSLTQLNCSAAVDGTLAVSGLTPGNTYYLQLWNNGSEEGTFDVSLTENTLSAGDFELNGFEYYPNPVSDKLFISAQNNIDQLTVYNMIGQRVMVQNPDAVRAELDMTSLTQGAYFVQVTVNGATETVQIIKK